MKDLINTGQDRSKTKVTQRSSVVGTTASTFEKLGEVLLDLAKGISEVRKEQAEDYEALTVVLRGQEKRMDKLEDNQKVAIDQNVSDMVTEGRSILRHEVDWLIDKRKKDSKRIDALEENLMEFDRDLDEFRSKLEHPNRIDLPIEPSKGGEKNE